MSKIVGIGACVFDTLYTVPTYPTEDTKMRAVSSKASGGGPVATGLVAAQKLGIDTAYLGVLSDDSGGIFLKKDFEKYGVNTDLIEVRSGFRSFASVLWLCADSATRTCVFDKGDLPPLVLNEAMKKAIADAEILMVDGNEMDAAVEAAKYARACGTKVLYDCGGLYAGVERLLAHTDIMIPSEEFALKMTGADTAEDAAARLYEEYRPEVLVITQGRRGGILMDGQGMRRYASYAVEAVDTNGCGDTFHGAFAAGKIRGMSNDDACRYASAAAAVKCTRLGARDAMATDQECRAFLRENGVFLD